jgi:Zn-dependent metalloprotease
MCREPHSAVFRRIAANPNAPQDVRDAAQQQLGQASFQNLVNKADSHTGVPSSGADKFTCAIYSMNNKDFEEHAREEHPGPITNWDAIMKLPGILYKDTNGFLVKNADGSSINDVSLDQAFNGFQTVYNFYKTCFGRNSVDDKGLELRGTIHLSRGYDNAFWDADKKSMFFGDGGRFDGRGWLMADPSERGAAYLTNWHAPYSLDILGHELTHGVVQHTADLGTQQYEKRQNAAFAEAGTLDEHIADCFGIMVKQFSKNEDAASGGWEMAPDWYSVIAMTAMGWEQGYMRTFYIPENKAKQADNGPKHMKELVPWLDKHGEPEDPHTNCGIPNHAFYLAAQSFRGHTWEKAGKIWYAALTDPKFRLPEVQTLSGWRDLTTAHAEQLFGTSGKDTVESAWQQVGL